MEDITRLYLRNAPAYLMEAEGLIMQILARLIRSFSIKPAANASASDRMTLDRIRNVITYVEDHFREPVSLQDISGHLGLGKEYFCRFFKKNMGISFLQYLNEVRIYTVVCAQEIEIPQMRTAPRHLFTCITIFTCIIT